MKYGKVNTTSGRLQSVEIYEGETIEQKVNRIVNNNEPITDGAPIIFTERKDGVLPFLAIVENFVPVSQG